MAGYLGGYGYGGGQMIATLLVDVFLFGMMRNRGLRNPVNAFLPDAFSGCGSGQGGYGNAFGNCYKPVFSPWESSCDAFCGDGYPGTRGFNNGTTFGVNPAGFPCDPDGTCWPDTMPLPYQPPC